MKLSVFNILFNHEIKILSRNKVLVSLFSLIILILISSLWIGSSMLQKQQETIGKITQTETAMTDSLKTRIKRIEANQMVYPGFIWDDPTFAYNTARNEGPKYAVKKPFALQALNVGQSDVQPFYYKVYINKKQYLTYESEIENSFLQFIGNFDFAFVVIYLFPLLIIVFSYNVLSSEKEQGTWVLLKTSNHSIARMILWRIVIRYILFTVFFWLIVTPFLISQIGGSFLITTNWAWLMAFVSLYFAFWFAISFLVNSFSMSSNVNAMVLIFIWLFTGIIVPNLLQVGLSKTYPIPSRIDMLTEERNAINKYFEKDGQELTKDVFSSPRAMIRQASIVTPEMVYGYGVIVYKSQEIKDAATAVAEGKLYTQIQKQQDAISRFQLLSPALMMQEELSALTGTHWHQFNQFSLDVDKFRKETQQFYYPKMAHENTCRTFSLDDADAIPQFKSKDYRDFSWTNLRQTFFTYLGIIAIVVFAGYRRMLDSTK
ncbi:ABC transporter permease subunit [Dyadobacter sp. CY345]|uniref:ABC transporter permease subunit n=1 Tax=Dyadobacter sp. CY345 TaxID=2909335 RepID=UPI001F434B19|nr:ABC transporter permease subunit [Dyadobacter sp. CY345]MCF2447006.1 ABC transporter permease subunit [Dyadobacter sp. CY345]